MMRPGRARLELVGRPLVDLPGAGLRAEVISLSLYISYIHTCNMCIDVYVHICMYAYIYIYIYIYIHTYMFMYTYMCMCMYM